jgi:hypothetical protein
MNSLYFLSHLFPYRVARCVIFTAIKNVLRQGNLNPEIEEKLLTLQRYQEKQAKGEPFDPTSYASYTTRGASRHPKSYDSPQDSDESEDDLSDHSDKPSARRRAGNMDDDDEWVIDTPRKYIKKADREKMEKKRDSHNYSSDSKKSHDEKPKIIVKTTDTSAGQIRKNIIFCNRSDNAAAQNTFKTTIIEPEKTPEKALLANKLKMKAAQKNVVVDENVKQHKLQVCFE